MNYREQPWFSHIGIFKHVLLVLKSLHVWNSFSTCLTATNSMSCLRSLCDQNPFDEQPLPGILKKASSYTVNSWGQTVFCPLWTPLFNRDPRSRPYLFSANAHISWCRPSLNFQGLNLYFSEQTGKSWVYWSLSLPLDHASRICQQAGVCR